MLTRVRFKDGTEVTRTWGGTPGNWPDGIPMTAAAVLAAAIALASVPRGGEPHDGAWLEFAGEEGKANCP